MSMYTVHVRASDFDRPHRAAEAVFVREGFSWGAFSYAPLWCVARRCWLALFVWTAAVVAVVALANWLAIHPLAIPGALFVLQVLFGLEAAQFRRRSLARRGYQMADVVSGHGREEAGITFAHREIARTEAQPAPAAVYQAAAAARPRPMSAQDSYGLAPLGGGS